MNMNRCMNILTVVLIMIIMPMMIYAAPSISGASGNVAHGQNVVVTGSSFGVKSSAAPVIWDNCSGTNITDKWSGGWPNVASSSYNMNYRTPVQVGRNIPLPHSHITKYATGCHVAGVYNSGQNVILWKNRTMSSFPQYTYVSWYERFDDNWKFGIADGGGTADDNLKAFDYSTGTSPYTMNSSTDSNWYLEWNARPLSKTDTNQGWHLNDDGSSLNAYWPNNYAVNPMGGSWTKVEVEICYTNQSSGYIKLWENGVLKQNYSGPTDKYSGTARNEGIGGFARSKTPGNWRYYADMYLDYSRCRVIVGNASTLTASTKREVQIPSAWSDGSITVNVNQGAFSDGQTAYLYVVDSNGTVNSNGYQITFGKGGTTTPPTSDTTPPATPSGVTVTVIQ